MSKPFELHQPAASDAFDWRKYSNEDRQRRLPPGQSLAKKFPHLEYAAVPDVKEPEDWMLTLDGDVASPTVLSMADLFSFTRTEKTQDFHCITGWSVFDTCWDGIKGDAIAQLVEPRAEVTSVLVHGRDQFSTSLWIDDFLNGLIAFGYSGLPLAASHGFPLRFIAPAHLYQFKSCKWLTRIEFLAEHRPGFWEVRAYSDSALAWENDRYTNPMASKGKSYRDVQAAKRELK